MTEFSELIHRGAAHAWLYIPTAVALGALHGLEPGHSKTMMAAFIVAVRGTIRQAVLLGLSAAISHSLVIWLLAATALYLGSRINAETSEPYFQIASGIVILILAAWMFARTRRDVTAAAHHPHHHDHDHPHDQDHEHAHHHPDSHGHQEGCEDAHERAHALEIQQRFANRDVTTGQIILFGLTGGLLPCPAAFSILIVCLQLKQVALGFGIVAAFSVGLALTLVLTGSLAAWSVHHASKRFKGFGEMARRAPYISSGFLVILAVYMIFHGWTGLHLH